MAKLNLVIDGITIREYQLEQGDMYLGRGIDNTIQINDPAASGKHLVLKIIPSDYLEGHLEVSVEDLNSTNGTKINGKSISKSRLVNGDNLQIGRQVFNFVDDDTDHPDFTRTDVILPGGEDV